MTTGLSDQTQPGAAGALLQSVAMKSGLGPVLERFDATLQLGGALGIRSDSRTHRQSIGLF